MPRKVHLARSFYVRGDTSSVRLQLRCNGPDCNWVSDKTLSEHEQRVQHRRHRRDMGEEVSPFLKLPQAERLKRIKQVHTRSNSDDLCRECWEDWPCITIRLVNGDPVNVETGELETDW